MARFVRLRAVPAARCIALPNAIDLNEFAPDGERRAHLRAQMGLNGEFAWLAAARMTPAKDLPNLLRAFALVREACPQARLWIVGEAARDPSAREREMTAPIAEAAEWRNGVLMLGLRRDMPALLDAADGFVLSSAWEGMPLAVGEAMAMEKPVVATDVGGMRELMGEAGAIVPPRDAEGLARAMLALMAQPAETRRETGCAARRRIAEHFNMDACADEWEALYRLLAAGRA